MQLVALSSPSRWVRAPIRWWRPRKKKVLSFAQNDVFCFWTVGKLNDQSELGPRNGRRGPAQLHRGQGSDDCTIVGHSGGAHTAPPPQMPRASLLAWRDAFARLPGGACASICARPRTRAPASTRGDAPQQLCGVLFSPSFAKSCTGPMWQRHLKVASDLFKHVESDTGS